MLTPTRPSWRYALRFEDLLETPCQALRWAFFMANIKRINRGIPASTTSASCQHTMNINMIMKSMLKSSRTKVISPFVSRSETLFT